MAIYNIPDGAWKDRTPASNARSLTITSDVQDQGNTPLHQDTVIHVNVARDDTPTEVGTPFNKSTMDTFETRIQNAFKPCMTYYTLWSSGTGQETGITLPNTALNYKLLEIFYSSENYTTTSKRDGLSSQRIHITNYNNDNLITLNSISCGKGNDDDFYLKTVTYNIKKSGSIISVGRVNGKHKRLIYHHNNGSYYFTVESGDTIDLRIYKIIGYRTDN